jgi:hypothetical protein
MFRNMRFLLTIVRNEVGREIETFLSHGVAVERALMERLELRWRRGNWVHLAEVNLRETERPSSRERLEGRSHR